MTKVELNPENAWVARNFANEEHIWTKNSMLLRKAWERMKLVGADVPEHRELRKAFYREMLRTHAHNQSIVRTFRL